MRLSAAAPVPENVAGIVLGYHLYTLDRKRRSTQRDQAGEHARGHRFPVRKRYIVDGRASTIASGSTGLADQGRGAGLLPVQNETSAGLACRCRPASSGSIRPTRRAASSSSARPHRPQAEGELLTQIGTAFDVVSERKQVDFEKIASNVYEVE